jgi:hypothetical protein
MGVKHGHTTLFRGIKYATLDDAFSEPKIRAYPYGSNLDATVFG